MKQITRLVTVFVLCLSVASCRDAAEPVAVEIPPGFMAVTEAQQELAAGVQRLSRGMSRAEVIQHLGQPAEEEADLLFYILIEGADGGYYVSATLHFDEHGLSAAELGFGHVSIERGVE
jgi:hypothetical protein